MLLGIYLGNQIYMQIFVMQINFKFKFTRPFYNDDIYN